jgi:hypothetical protein
MFRERGDLSESTLTKLLVTNPARLHGMAVPE